MSAIPEAFSRAVIQMHGAKGRLWLSSLDRKVMLLKARWELELLPVFESSYNYVVPVISGGEEAVLKICISGREFRNERDFLSFYGGTGTCRLLDSDADEQALLLERLKPGSNLKSIIREGEAVKTVASLIRTMREKAGRPPAGFPTVRDHADGIRSMRRYYAGRSCPFAEPMIQKVESLFPELISTQKDIYLLHGDFHHGNIIRSHSGWKLIDPKGIAAEMEYELIPFLLNHLPTVGGGDTIDTRVLLFREELGIDIDRTYAWGLCRSLLSAWWSIEDHFGITGTHLVILRHFYEKVRDAAVK